MPSKAIPTSFTAGRKLTINGVTYQPGDAVPIAAVRSVRKLSALLSRRHLIPNVDPHKRLKYRLRVPTPTDISAVFRKSL